MKVIKKTAVVVTAFALSMLSVIHCFAETSYFESGYFYSYINNDAVRLVGWDYRTSVLPVPDKLNNRPVTAIANDAFSDNENLTGIDFTNAINLTAIGMYSFSNCTNMVETLVLPEQIYFIDECAFEGCSSITEVEINSGLYYIANQCFNKCNSLQKVTLNDGLVQIRSYAFANCPELEYVLIPSTVTDISPTAFENDSNLKIYGFADSYAQTYAHEHNIPFVEMVKFLLGDVDGVDGVNINDVTAIQSHLAELKTVEGVYLLAADANLDGIVDISDATAIQMKLAEYELPYPIGQYVTKEIVLE
ncbi:Leucine rich repeat-containing protein [Ruminococcaceae bacterium P7]|nr:Leucine rich repeat-containing protein [Ruminococcaceae bacterium P7]